MPSSCAAAHAEPKENRAGRTQLLHITASSGIGALQGHTPYSSSLRLLHNGRTEDWFLFSEAVFHYNKKHWRPLIFCLHGHAAFATLQEDWRPHFFLAALPAACKQGRQNQWTNRGPEKNDCFVYFFAGSCTTPLWPPLPTQVHWFRRDACAHDICINGLCQEHWRPPPF